MLTGQVEKYDETGAWAVSNNENVRTPASFYYSSFVMKRLSVLLALFVPILALAQDSDCKAGDKCSLQGVLRIYRTPPVFTSALEIGSTCVPLALPKFAYENYKKWSDQTVVVIGVAHSHGVADGVLYYELGGRNVTGAACSSSAVALFVTDLKLSSEK